MKAEAVTVESQARAQSPVLVQRKVAADRRENISAPSLVSEVLRSAGQPLDNETRAFMEPRFGHDFSRVRVYTDGTAARSAQSVNALAYTVGQRVVFDAGQYSPQTNEGRRLIAHELAHTLQQGTSTLSAPLEVASSADPAEGEADRLADRVMTGVDHQPLIPNAAGDVGPTLFRKPKTPAATAPEDLHQCDTTTEMPKINNAVAAADVSATNAVQGLQELLNIWGTTPATTSQKSTARALARAFSIEFDKTGWVDLGIGTAAEVNTLDIRDHDAVETILANFKEIERAAEVSATLSYSSRRWECHHHRYISVRHSSCREPVWIPAMPFCMRCHTFSISTLLIVAATHSITVAPSMPWRNSRIAWRAQRTTSRSPIRTGVSS